MFVLRHHSHILLLSIVPSTEFLFSYPVRMRHQLDQMLMLMIELSRVLGE
jgi:hypothetical protein